jgi:nitrite reductase/ring-hydroxylating ferredoxin subunit
MAERTRRDFLKTLVGGAAVAVLPGACVSTLDPAPAFDVTPFIHTSSTSNTIVIDVTAYPELVAGGAGAVRLTSSLLPNPILVIEREGGYDALSAVCTHVGCPLGYDGRDVACPCHGSKFDPATGAVVHPPAVTPLATYPTSFVAASNVLSITLPR